MELYVKHFSELTTEELFEIYKLRALVFVVEQNCAYQDVDDADKQAYHLWLKDENDIEKTKLDYMEMILDWESARYTKPDKPLNAYDTLYK